MSIQAVIFDFGNVLAFFDHRRATRQLARFSRLPAEEIHRILFTPALEDAFESGRLAVPEFLALLRRQCAVEGDDNLLSELFADVFTVNPDVCCLVPRLKARNRLVLGSNCTPLHSQRFLHQFGDTLSHFNGVVLSHEIGVRKPTRTFYEECVRRTGCRPQECVFIDDLADNVAGAEACGVRGILYRHPEDLSARLRELGIEFSASSASLR
jgi:putative hydrolase of the HAD superfamily